VSPARGTRVARPTYADLQRWVRATYGYVPPTAWIADVKAQCGLAPRRAQNRRGWRRRRPCPPDRVPHLVAALRHFGLIAETARPTR
jgi:hypothetical protein